MVSHKGLLSRKGPLSCQALFRVPPVVSLRTPGVVARSHNLGASKVLLLFPFLSCFSRVCLFCFPVCFLFVSCSYDEDKNLRDFSCIQKSSFSSFSRTHILIAPVPLCLEEDSLKLCISPVLSFFVSISFRHSLLVFVCHSMCIEVGEWTYLVRIVCMIVFMQCLEPSGPDKVIFMGKCVCVAWA
ncbi:hypothetical protein L873DRAFT_782959 [Choiromyces venosus 120613-1]|uniref:Uncharacterized protein n=1 Tax=Choiromyces venosus 120613-1 TaxID=1336337 RepID=A0A3N4IXE5_9PEZI|nr:hypothetical protein L873DRAFT_782959 [Choiromyces venosus 120613-1]